jgi:hypothetical protein
MTTQQIETPPEGPPMRSAQEAFQNHEDRLQSAEAMLAAVGGAFPHLRDALGLPRFPHAFTKDDMSGVDFNPNASTLETLQRENAAMRGILDKILERLPQLPEGPTNQTPTAPPPSAPSGW